ncbi:unnamed protein product [Closterium sp. Yama58-4]|nr:unnamed protein product [Closterium sp. Yama58-4]
MSDNFNVSPFPRSAFPSPSFCPSLPPRSAPPFPLVLPLPSPSFCPSLPPRSAPPFPLVLPLPSPSFCPSLPPRSAPPFPLVLPLPSPSFCPSLPPRSAPPFPLVLPLPSPSFCPSLPPRSAPPFPLVLPLPSPSFCPSLPPRSAPPFPLVLPLPSPSFCPSLPPRSAPPFPLVLPLPSPSFCPSLPPRSAPPFPLVLPLPSPSFCPSLPPRSAPPFPLVLPLPSPSFCPSLPPRSAPPFPLVLPLPSPSFCPSLPPRSAPPFPLVLPLPSPSFCPSLPPRSAPPFPLVLPLPSPSFCPSLPPRSAPPFPLVLPLPSPSFCPSLPPRSATPLPLVLPLPTLLELGRGLVPVVHPQVALRQAYLAGLDQARAAGLVEAFLEPSTRAVVCARGGYGCARLLPLLESALRGEGQGEAEAEGEWERGEWEEGEGDADTERGAEAVLRKGRAPNEGGEDEHGDEGKGQQARRDEGGGKVGEWASRVEGRTGCGGTDGDREGGVMGEGEDGAEGRAEARLGVGGAGGGAAREDGGCRAAGDCIADVARCSIADVAQCSITDVAQGSSSRRSRLATEIRRKRFFGFSDVTALHSFFQAELAEPVISFHAPMPATSFFIDQSALASRAALRAALFEPSLALACPPLQGRCLQRGCLGGTSSCCRPNRVQGRLLGGNLSVLASLGMGPHHHARAACCTCMGHETQSHVTALSGLVLGSFSNFQGMSEEARESVRPIVEEQYGGDWDKWFWLGQVALPHWLPVLAGLPIGHTSDNRVAPIGALVELDVEAATLTVV